MPRHDLTPEGAVVVRIRGRIWGTASGLNQVNNRPNYYASQVDFRLPMFHNLPYYRMLAGFTILMEKAV